MLNCDWSLQISLDVNFSKLMDSNQILRIDFVCIHYHLWEMSCQIIGCKIFAPYDFLEMNSLQLWYIFLTGFMGWVVENSQEANSP